jgi:hypothetical protein
MFGAPSINIGRLPRKQRERHEDQSRLSCSLRPLAELHIMLMALRLRL